MTALLERLITFIAPHMCLVCGSEDNIICEACMPDTFIMPPSSCVLCGVPTVGWRACHNCQRSTKLNSVWVASEYQGLVADVIKRFKFERARATYKPLAEALNNCLPFLGKEALVVPLPTVPRRVRQRGYDHVSLIARGLAALRDLGFAAPLVRLHNAQQVGASRKQRRLQAKTAYDLSDPKLVKGRNILLIDDICTTGASLSAAAGLLHEAGAIQINAAVVAWQPLRANKSRLTDENLLQ